MSWLSHLSLDKYSQIINSLGKIFKNNTVVYTKLVEPIDYKRLYELSIIEKEQIINERSKCLEQVKDLTKELNEYKIENFSKKNYYQKNKEKIIEKEKEYKKNYMKSTDKIKEYKFILLFWILA